MSLPTLMVLDGEGRTTLGVVRALGRRGVPIIVGSNHLLGRSGFSRNVRHRFDYPSPDVALAAAHSTIIQHGARSGNSAR